MNNIDNTYDMSKIHLLKMGNTKSYLSENTFPKLKKSIKENVQPPNKNIKVFTIDFAYKPESDTYPLRIICVPYTLTPKLALVTKDDDIGLTIRYTQNELKKYGFKKEHIKRIMKAMEEETASYHNFADSISHILEVTK
jgi:hypothetical protein